MAHSVECVKSICEPESAICRPNRGYAPHRLGPPAWLAVLTRLDPLAYAVDPMRRAVFAYVSAPPRLSQRLNPGMTWFGWHLPIARELGLVAAGAAAALTLAICQFSRTE